MKTDKTKMPAPLYFEEDELIENTPYGTVTLGWMRDFGESLGFTRYDNSKPLPDEPELSRAAAWAEKNVDTSDEAILNAWNAAPREERHWEDVSIPSMCFDQNVITGEITAISSSGGHTNLGLYADKKHSATKMNKELGISPEQAEQIKQEHTQAIKNFEHKQTMGERMAAANIAKPVIEDPKPDHGLTL